MAKYRALPPVENSRSQLSLLKKLWMWIQAAGLEIGYCSRMKEAGLVAQSVEQGIENPCVGGSIPPRATFLFLLAALGFTGCAEPCETACQRTAFAIGRCIGDWSADWSDLGASSKTDFRERCQETWKRNAAGLESRELEEALLQCETLQDEVLDLDCDTLRAIYVR
jgi:hypothetical protein